MSRSNKYQTQNAFETFESWVNKLQDEAKRTAIKEALVKCVRLENSNAEQQSNALDILNKHLSDSHRIMGKIKIKWGSITSYQALLKGQQSLASPNVITEEASAQATATPAPDAVVVVSGSSNNITESPVGSPTASQQNPPSSSSTPIHNDPISKVQEETTAANASSVLQHSSTVKPIPETLPTESQQNSQPSSSTPPESKPLLTFTQWMEALQDQQRKKAIETAIMSITFTNNGDLLADLEILNKKLFNAYRINPEELNLRQDAFLNYQAMLIEKQRLALAVKPSSVSGSSAEVGQAAQLIVSSASQQPQQPQQPIMSRERHEEITGAAPPPPVISSSPQDSSLQSAHELPPGTETSAAQSPQLTAQEKMQQLIQLANAYHPTPAQQAENDANRKARKTPDKTTQCLTKITKEYQSDAVAGLQRVTNTDNIEKGSPEDIGLYHDHDLSRGSNTTRLANNEGWFLEQKTGDQITTVPVLFSSELPDLRITLFPQEARTHFQKQLQDFFSITEAKSDELLKRLERIYTQNLPGFVPPHCIANFQAFGHDSSATLTGEAKHVTIEYDSTADILKLHITAVAMTKTMGGGGGGPYDLGAVHYTIELSKNDGFQFTRYHADNPLLDRFISRLPNITPQEEYDFLRQVLIKQQQAAPKWKPNIADITVLFQYAEEEKLKHNFEGLDLTNISAGQRIALLNRPYLSQADQNAGIAPEKYIGFFKGATLTAQQFEQLKNVPEILQGANLYGQALSVTNVNTIAEHKLNHLFNGAIISDFNVIKKCVELGLKCEGVTVTSDVLRGIRQHLDSLATTPIETQQGTIHPEIQREKYFTILKNINLRGQILTEDDVKFIAKHKLNHLFNGAIISDFNVIETCFNLGLKCEGATVTSGVLKKLQEEITTRTASIDSPSENSGLVRRYEHQREKYFTILKNINLRGQILTEDDVKFIAKHKLDNLMKGAVLADENAAHAWIRSGLSYSAQPVLSDALKAAQQAQFNTFQVLYGKDNTPHFTNIIQVEKYLFEGKDAPIPFREVKRAFETTKLIIKTYTEANEKNPHPDILTQFRYLQGMVPSASVIQNKPIWTNDPKRSKEQKETEKKAVDAKKDALIVLPTLDLAGKTLNAADIQFIAEHKLDHLMRGTIIADQTAVNAWITSGLSDTFKPKISAAFLAATQPLVTEEEKAAFLATEATSDTSKRLVTAISTAITTTSLDAEFAKFKQCWKLHYPQKKSPEFENIIEVRKYLYEHSRLIDAPSFEVKAVKNAYAVTQLAMYHQFETAMCAECAEGKALKELIIKNKNNPGELAKLAAPFIEHAEKLGVLSEIPYLVEAKKISKEEENKAELQRQAELKEQAEAEKQAAAARALARQAEQEKQAEKQKREEIQTRQAELGKQAVSIGLLTIAAGSGIFTQFDADITSTLPKKHRLVDARYDKGNTENPTEQQNSSDATATIFINPTVDKKQMAKSFEPLYQAMAQGNALMFMHQPNATSPVSQTPHQFQFLERLDARRISQIPTSSQIPEAFAYQIEALNKFRAWVNDNQVQINDVFTEQAETTSNTLLLTALIDLAKRDQSLVFSSISPKPLDGVDSSLIRAYFEEYVKTKPPEAVAAQNKTAAQSGQGGGAPTSTVQKQEVREPGANLHSGAGASSTSPRDELDNQPNVPISSTVAESQPKPTTTAQENKPTCYTYNMRQAVNEKNTQAATRSEVTLQDIILTALSSDQKSSGIKLASTLVIELNNHTSKWTAGTTNNDTTPQAAASATQQTAAYLELNTKCGQNTDANQPIVQKGFKRLYEFLGAHQGNKTILLPELVSKTASASQKSTQQAPQPMIATSPTDFLTQFKKLYDEAKKDKNERKESSDYGSAFIHHLGNFIKFYTWVQENEKRVSKAFDAMSGTGNTTQTAQGLVNYASRCLHSDSSCLPAIFVCEPSGTEKSLMLDYFTAYVEQRKQPIPMADKPPTP